MKKSRKSLVLNTFENSMESDFQIHDISKVLLWSKGLNYICKEYMITFQEKHHPVGGRLLMDLEP